MGKLKIKNLNLKDLSKLKKMLNNLKVFSKEEVKISIEMAQEYLKKGKKSDYNFLVAKGNGDILGFICFGPTPLTYHTFDLYWIAVSKNYQGKSIGSILLKKCEEKVKKEGGKILIIETSSTNKYEKARNFYKKFGFKKITEIKNFYKYRDNKIIYAKYFNGGN